MRYGSRPYLIYDNSSEFKLHFEHLCDSYGIKHKPTTVRNPQANALLECVHQVIGQMLCTAELDMAQSVVPNDVDVFMSCRTCQTNKKRKLNYGHLPAKTVIRIPWEALCVDLIGPYTLKGKDDSQIDFIQMELSGFNVEANRKELISGE